MRMPMNKVNIIQTEEMKYIRNTVFTFFPLGL